jgi:hypothetical protein
MSKKPKISVTDKSARDIQLMEDMRKNLRAMYKAVKRCKPANKDDIMTALDALNTECVASICEMTNYSLFDMLDNLDDY